MDGCLAATYVAYALSEVATIYPITPIAEMGEVADRWAMQGRKNVFGQTMQVKELESELGAAGATHGVADGGALATTFTSSQGLMLMLPNMYKIAGNLLPAVFHIGSRVVGTHALSIFCDHSDVMACRTTGFAMLCSSSVQETHDLAIVAHLAAIESSVPFLHWMDGFRTSNEMQSIDVVSYEALKALVPWEKVAAFRSRGMNPEHSDVRGTAQNPDIYFQNREAYNKYYDAVPAIVQQKMDQVAALTGRAYHLMDYVGDPDAEYVTISMASSSDVIDETVQALQVLGYKVGHIKVRLYRPFPKEAFLAALPQSCKRIAVLDRDKEPGAPGEPLYQDVATALFESGRNVQAIRGRYGLGSKDFNPGMAKAVFDELARENPKKQFTVGITDDVTNLSIDYEKDFDPIADDCKQIIFYGIGNDGTVGATKQAASIIGADTNLYAQAYFNYSAKKSGGYTISQLRFADHPIRAAYGIVEADYVGCNKDTYIEKYDMLDRLKPGGIFVLNSQWTTMEQLEEALPAKVKRQIAQKKVKFYNVNAIDLAHRHHLGEHINMIMEAVFFKLLDIIPLDEAITALKKSVETTYGHEGQLVVQNNWAAIDEAVDAMHLIDYPDAWLQAQPTQDDRKREAYIASLPEWERTVGMPMLQLQGNELPVSKMIADGVFPAGTTAYEKRKIAAFIPIWDKDKCIECTECSFVCSHAAIRPFIATDSEMEGAPASYETKEAWDGALKGMHWRIQIYPDDCTGCASCSTVCPAGALPMQPVSEHRKVENINLSFAKAQVSSKAGAIPRQTILGSQLYTPLLEFSGACGGCGETPYVKLLTQLFGEHTVIANATGCSSIWGANAPSQAYCRNDQGLGPAWGNSLFEDNAEYGYGIAVALAHRRQGLIDLACTAVEDPETDADLCEALSDWLAVKNDYEKSYSAGLKVKEFITKNANAKYAAQIAPNADVLGKKSVWIVGGDGWAYDIGFAGLDHVLASGIDINMLVLDTQCYSNTGGQTSKATPYGACTKYSYTGKREYHKNLGQMMMTYRNVYVASVAIGGNMNQVVKAFSEAEAYPGPSIVIAYCPCLMFGIKDSLSHSVIAQREAVENKFWPIYRFNPNNKENPLFFDPLVKIPEAQPLPPAPKWSPKPWVRERIISFGESAPQVVKGSPLIVDYAGMTLDMQPMLLNQTRFAVLGQRVSAAEAQAIYDRLKSASIGNAERISMNQP